MIHEPFIFSDSVRSTVDVYKNQERGIAIIVHMEI